MKLSVFVVTYNHEKFISQCLDSIVNQKTEFDFEIIIGDDYSTDSTRKICEEYCHQHNNVRILPSEKNVGLVKNWERTLNACKGEYIALIEGDDYWVDDRKLEKQIDFLEKNNDYSFVFHKVKVVYEDNYTDEKLFTHLEEREYSASEVYKKWSVLSSSVVFRNNITPITFPKALHYTDIYLTLLLFEKGRAYCLNTEAVAYRRHSNSLSMHPTVNQSIKLYYQYCYLKKRFPKYKKISIQNQIDYLEYLAKSKKFKGILKYQILYLLKCPQKTTFSFVIKILKDMFKPI